MAKQFRVTVWGLDVWGHGSHECSAAFDCPCITVWDGEPELHNDVKCECGYDINDRFRVGSFAIDSDGKSDLLRAMVEEGHVDASQAAFVDFDEMGEYGYQLNDNRDGKPAYQLEIEEISEKEEG